MFRALREISRTVAMANQLAGEKKWTVFLTNRSFIAQVVATLFALAGITGIFIPISAGDVVEIISIVGYLVAQGWAVWERIAGKTSVVWNRRQAAEADALSQALARAGATPAE